MIWDRDRANGANGEVVLSKALIERTLRRNGGDLQSAQLARELLPSLIEAAQELGIQDLNRHLMVRLIPEDIKDSKSKDQIEDSPMVRGSLRYDSVARELTDLETDESIAFTKTQGKMFSPLFSRTPEIVPIDELIEASGGYPNQKAVKVHILKMKRKLQLFSAKPMILSVHGVGYRFKEPARSID